VPDKFDWLAYLNGQATLPNGFNTAVNFRVDLEYANGSTIQVSDRYSRDDGTDFNNGILFEGENGRFFVNRGRLSGKPVEDLTEADGQELQERIVKLYKGKQPAERTAHMQNFFDCIRDRSQPVSDVQTHHRTMTACHLSNIALMLGRELKWDPDKEQFVNDAEAEKFRSRQRRDEFQLT
jgi:hypothetical protein